MISQQQANDAKAKPLDVTVGGSMANTSYPAFMDLVKRQLREDYRDEDLTSEGAAHLYQFRSAAAEKGGGCCSDHPQAIWRNAG